MNYNTNIEKISRESAGIASQKYNSLIDFTLLLDDADPNKGIVIPLNSLQKITMDENIFSMLPTAKILLLDSGKFFDLYPLNIGRKIFINIYLKNKNDQNKKEPYITTRMTIQDVAISPDITSSQIAYSINCIYDCQSLFNSIMPYPYKDSININIKESSVDVLRNIIQKIGMTFKSDIETNDSQYWINGTLNNKNFIDHIINHSFIKKEDATLMFTDINGKCKYSSIKTLCNQPEKNSYIHTKKYNDLLKTASSEELNKKYPNTAIYGSIYNINPGALITNEGGDKQSVSLYDPIDFIQDYDSFTFGDTLDLGTTFDKKYLKYNASVKKSYLASISNKEASQLEKTNKTINAGIHFPDMHENYEISPAHNDNCKKSFFQTFFIMSLDMGKQLDSYYNLVSNLPRLGSLIYVDFNGETEHKTYTGRYLITRIQHVYTKGNSYSIAITCCSDGYYYIRK
jgi:hypothetical protein